MKRILLAIFLLFALIACTTQEKIQNNIETNYENDNNYETTDSDEGNVVFVITDAAADMRAVTSVKVTIDNIKVYNEAKGWTTISSNAQTYDLLKLKSENSQVLLAQSEIKEGSYSQVKMDVSNVVITDDKGEHEAKMPSEELKITGNLNINKDSTSTVKLDFIVDESLHKTNKGEYVMAPVVAVETRENADVNIRSDNKVEINSGEVNTDIKVGMDLNGNVGVDLGIRSSQELKIENGQIKVNIGL